MKKYIIFAGVNGAGKSTLYQTNPQLFDMPRVNMDEIVREFGNWRNAQDVMAAGKIAVKRLKNYITDGVSFNQETTLCGQSIFRNIQLAKTAGYYIELYYVGVDSVEVAKERVRHRVLAGGHGIPEKDIEKRYRESLMNLKAVLPLCDLLVLYDNTEAFVRIADFENGICTGKISQLPIWLKAGGNVMEPDMQDRINYAVKKWELDHLEAIYEHSAKGVFSAESKIFGSVILKINQHITQLQSEYQMLAQLSGRHNCKVYAFDENAGLLLEERIFPGTVLRRETSLEKRIQVFLQIFQEIHMPADSGATYLNWLEHIREYCVSHQTAVDMASRAHLFCVEMFGKYPDRVLLHGDLHHDNLLLRTDGSYAMIDPKGIIGPAIMDLPRFILNELDTGHSCSDRQHIEEVIRRLSQQSGYPAADIGKLFYMETVLEKIWCLEDGEEMNMHKLEIADYIVSSQKGI